MKRFLLRQGIAFTLLWLMSTSASYAQDVDAAVKGKASDVWRWINTIGLLVILIVFVIGIITTYSKKNSDQPGEFKRSVIGFGAGLAFLIIALGLLNVVRSAYQSSTSVSF